MLNNKFHYMKITLNIKNNKLPFFLELVKNFDFITIEESDEFISEEQKKIVFKRMGDKSKTFINSEILEKKIKV